MIPPCPSLIFPGWAIVLVLTGDVGLMALLVLPAMAGLLLPMALFIRLVPAIVFPMTSGILVAMTLLLRPLSFLVSPLTCHVVGLSCLMVMPVDAQGGIRKSKDRLCVRHNGGQADLPRSRQMLDDIS